MGLSPMMTHYKEIKEKYQDCIIFYRLGDFYEMFFEDAIKASKILDLTLTGRDCGLKERAPMCGVPHHSAENYIFKLVEAGEKVAICEQITLPSKGKVLVEREVVKIVTPGTLSDNFLDDKSNNFICSIYLSNVGIGLSWLDITTGEFFTQNFSSSDFITEAVDSIIKINPSEIISNKEGADYFNNTMLVSQEILPKFNYFTESEFDITIASKNLRQQLSVASLSVFNLDGKDDSIKSAGALISYLRQTQKHSLLNINNLFVITSNDSMMLDSATIKNLELTKTIRDGKKYGTLLWLLDKTKTSMGARKLQSYIFSPLTSVENINSRLDGVECFYNNTLVRQSLSDLLNGFRDVGRLSGKISNNNLLPADCINLCKSLNVLPEIKFMLSGFDAPIISEISDNISDFTELCNLLEKAISKKEDKLDGDYIKRGYNEEFDNLRMLSVNGKSAMTEIETLEREKTGIKNLKIGFNRVFGFYLEVTNSFKDKVPYYFQRKQTLSNAERYVTDELKELEVKILSSEEKAEQLELSLYNEIKEILAGYIPKLQQTSDAIASLDVLLAFSIVAREKGYVKPQMLNSDMPLEILEGRHPVVEASLNVKFVPNDCYLDSGENAMAIITGPNMAGKSTYMRQVALITLMAHIGCYVPAKIAKIPVVDKIFTRIGASDSLTSNQSTFMVEMTETANILRNATSNSLIILDEIGRGTSTFDGLSIAWAVVEHITKNIKAKTLFATHYHELSELEGGMYGVKNYKITVKEMQGSFIFLRKIMRGSANKSFGIEVAELAGIDKTVTKRAREILKSLEMADITKSTNDCLSDDFPKEDCSEIERIIKDLDINNLSPMQAFNILTDLYEKITEK